MVSRRVEQTHTHTHTHVVVLLMSSRVGRGLRVELLALGWLIVLQNTGGPAA